MKSRYAVLFTIAAIVVAAPATAVPPKPINATVVTLLPADGTPDALRKAVGTFSKNVSKANSDAEAKRAQLDRQMEEGLDKAIAKAQSAGDINTVLALKAAKDKFATLTTSDVPLVKNALEFREKKTVEIETARVADAMKAAKELNEELEKAKKDETVKGNFDSAKTIADHQEKLIAWVQTIRSSAPQPTAARPSPVQQQPSAQSESKRPQTEPPRTITIQARNPNGVSIGMAKAGDTFRIQYVGGRWQCNSVMESPDAPPRSIQYEDNRCCIILANNPSSSLSKIPGLTRQTPFLFRCPEDGEYALRPFDGREYEYKRSDFNDNSGSVRYNVQLIHSDAKQSADSAAFRSIPGEWSETAPAPSAFGIQRTQSNSATIAQPGGQSTKIISINANRQGGTSIGRLNAGDTVRIRYVSGKWTHAPNDFRKVSPDEEWGPWNLCQTQLTIDPGSQFVVAVPKHTAEDPFEYTVDEAATYRLRIKDLDVGDSSGIVQYEVEIIPAGTR